MGRKEAASGSMSMNLPGYSSLERERSPTLEILCFAFGHAEAETDAGKAMVVAFKRT